MNMLDRVREGMRARARAFVLGPGVVDVFEKMEGHDDSKFSPPEYGEYITTSNAVYSVVTAKADLLASLPIRAFRLDREGRRELVEGELTRLLRFVNPRWTWSRLIRMTAYAQDLWGESFWFLERGESGKGRPREIWWGRPDRVRIVLDEKEYIGGYLYFPKSGAEPIPYGPEEVIWMPNPNPLDEFSGLAPLAAARLAADYASGAMKSNLQLYDQGMQPGGFITPPSGMTWTAEQAREARRFLDKRLKGVNKAHRWIVFREDYGVKGGEGFSPREAEFIDGLRWSLEEVCRAYHWPLDLVGGQRTYANVGGAMKMAWTFAVIPQARFIAEELVEQLLPMFGGADLLEFDTSEVAELQEAKSDAWERERGQIEMGALLLNEWREGQGKEPLPHGDVWWAPFSVVAVGEGTDGRGGTDGGTDGGGRMAPKGDYSRKLTDALWKGTIGGNGRRVGVYGSERHVVAWGRFARRTERHERVFGQMARGLFERQRDSVLGRLRQRMIADKRMADGAIGTDFRELTDGDGGRGAEGAAWEPFNMAQWQREFREGLRPVLMEILTDAGQAALGDLGLVLDFDLLRPEVQQYLERQAQRFAVEVNATTWNSLKGQLDEGLAAGEGIPELAERITEVMAGRMRSSGEMIARTEVLPAYNFGAVEAWGQSGVVRGKRWLTAIDGRERETHKGAHGQVVALEGRFEVGGELLRFPGDPEGSGENIINCRCGTTAVLDMEV